MTNEKTNQDSETETPTSSEQTSTTEGVKDPQTNDAPKAPVREPGTALSEDHVREALKSVIDPELFVNIVDLGLIYTVTVKDREDGKYDVDIEMTMTSPMCPAGPQLVGNSRQAISDIADVVEVDVKVVMDPPWNQDMMTDDAKDQLNIF